MIIFSTFLPLGSFQSKQYKISWLTNSSTWTKWKKLRSQNGSLGLSQILGSIPSSYCPNMYMDFGFWVTVIIIFFELRHSFSWHRGTASKFLSPLAWGFWGLSTSLSRTFPLFPTQPLIYSCAFFIVFIWIPIKLCHCLYHSCWCSFAVKLHLKVNHGII